jgi:hypothetical protein
MSKSEQTGFLGIRQGVTRERISKDILVCCEREACLHAPVKLTAPVF